MEEVVAYKGKEKQGGGAGLVLGVGRLDDVEEWGGWGVTEALCFKLPGSFKSLFFAWGIGAYSVLEGQKRILAESWWFCVYHVHVAGLAAFRISLSNRSGDPKSPIPSLGDIFFVSESCH